MHYLKKLKILLHYKIIILLFISLIYVYIIISNNYYHSKYNLNTNKIVGNISSIKIDGNKVSIILIGKEKIIVNYYLKNISELNQLKKYKLGYKLEIIGTISKPNNNPNFYLFNYRKYLLSKKIYYIMNATNIKLLDNNPNLYYKIKNYLINRLNKMHSNNYLKAFILGDNSSIDNEVLNSYQINGISHLFAISGMHITIFSSILLFILNKIIKNKKIIFILISLFLIFYMFITGLSPSIIRATLLFILININNIFKLKYKTLDLLLLVLSISLIINPYNIYNNGFLFSYIISLYLILFNSIINKHKNYIIKLLITSLISSLVSIPIMINSYGSINIISFIYNLFYVPFVSFILFPLSLVTLICPLFDNLLKILSNILESTSLYLSNIKYFIIILKHISLPIFIGYYLFITFILVKIKQKKYYFIVLLVIILFIHTNYNNIFNNSGVTILDVGQGDSILLTLHNKYILIDTGGKVDYKKDKWMQRKSNYSLVNNTIIPYLKLSGVKKINYLILTHGDYDHMGEAINLVNNFKVEKVIFNCGEFNELETDLIKVLDQKKIPYYSCIKELNIDDNKLYFLQTKEYDNENDNSNVIYTEIGGYKFMFMGDAGIDKEKDISDKYNISNIDVLKVGHHGSKTSSGESFINKINPKYSIISVGKNNRYGHPNKGVLNNLENSKIYRTDQDGSIMFKIKNNKLKIETCSP